MSLAHILVILQPKWWKEERGKRKVNRKSKIIKMLTLKQITEQTDRVIAGLEKKHFNGAREAIDQVLAVDKKRRETQQQLDQNLSEAKKMAAQIGSLMKEGKRDEADAIKEKVAGMKESNRLLDEQTRGRSPPSNAFRPRWHSLLRFGRRLHRRQP